MDHIDTTLSGRNLTFVECATCDGAVHKCEVILALRKLSASISLIACTLMIVIIWLFRKYRLFVQRMILYLTISALFLCTGYLMQENRPDGPICTFEAFWITLWLWAVLVWVNLITIYLLIALLKSIRTGKYEIVYHLFGWGLPLFMSCVPFIGNHYGPAGAWCWIQKDDEYVTHWRFSIWYGPLMILVALNFIAYCYILWVYKKKIGVFHGTHDDEAERQRKYIDVEIKPLVAFPLIYMALYIFSIINRLHNAVDPDNPVFALVVLQGMCNPLVGAVNAIAYGLDHNTRKKLNKREIMKALCNLKTRTTSQSDVIQEYNTDVACSSKRSNQEDDDQIDPDTGLDNPVFTIT